MTGLCVGGNEPPGSLKANKNSALPYDEGWVESRKILSDTGTRTRVFSAPPILHSMVTQNSCTEISYVLRYRSTRRTWRTYFRNSPIGGICLRELHKFQEAAGASIVDCGRPVYKCELKTNDYIKVNDIRSSEKSILSRLRTSHNSARSELEKASDRNWPIRTLLAEQSDGITMFRIPPMTSLMLHRCCTGSISL
ncbi:hypothetical protein ANN_11653 [Periplaneta americana]|uniref:Uncharacterized protein n=1 Tax=Periplaneta americana TaxID=6978 RepID=A0ABQ8T7X1_PERAM|nr:hypothetical protein ANN_11653 [Periplaneta americana]